MLTLIAILAAAISTPAQKPINVIADNRQECGIYRLAKHRREDNIRTAQKLVYKLNAEGRPARLIVLEPGQFEGVLFQTTSSSPVEVYTLNPC
jgi:hypothetical protein